MLSGTSDVLSQSCRAPYTRLQHSKTSKCQKEAASGEGITLESFASPRTKGQKLLVTPWQTRMHAIHIFQMTRESNFILRKDLPQ